MRKRRRAGEENRTKIQLNIITSILKFISNYIKPSGLLFQLENRDYPNGYKIKKKNNRMHI